MSADILSSKKVRVRKQHRCEYCMDSINKGETAETWSYADGGQIFRCYAHQECQAVVDHMEEFEQDPDYIDSNMFYDDIYQYWAEYLKSFFSYSEWQALEPRQRCAEILAHANNEGRYAQ